MPPAVEAMLARYRELLAERGDDWGRDYDDVGRALMRIWPFCDPMRLMSSWEASRSSVPEDREFLQIVLGALADPLPPGLAITTAAGIAMATELPLVPIGGSIPYLILRPGPGDAVPEVLDVVVHADDPYLEVDGHRLIAAAPVPAGRLRLTSDAPSRWTVVDQRGGGWFPATGLRKYDFHGRPYFHGSDVTIDVPSGPVTVTVARGVEFRTATTTVEVPAEDEPIVLDLVPERLYDAAARGWFGADLHVHLNYSGDQVATPADAACMQRGEGLHLLNLVAGNSSTGLIYDREALEATAGTDLPWSNGDTVARWGVEFRNDLLGHFHALNPSAPPTRYNTGHERSDEPYDWPPNSVAAAELRDLGATVGYTHPVMTALGTDGSPAPVFEEASPLMGLRTMHARELVADAALGLVDSVDLLGNEGLNIAGTEHLYHRLLGCGLRLAATAGTDVMLSRSRGLSNPPGWGRAYADLDGQPLSVEAWQSAVHACRTFATNGPWLELAVDGHGPGTTIAADGPVRLAVRAATLGVGIERLELVGPDGVLAGVDVAAEAAEVVLELDVAEPMWIAAAARGGLHLSTLGPQVHAHTSPVWVDVAGRSIARPADAAWCLDWLDRLEHLAHDHGHFGEPHHFTDLVDVIEDARTFYRAIATR